MTKLIDIENVTAYRGDTRVFHHLSLAIERGRNTVILGPNGAGKTTLLKLLAREIYPVAADDSAIRILGRDRWNVWELRAHLGIVSHDLQREYAGYASGLDVVLSGYYASVGVWAHQRFSDAQRAGARRVLDLLGIAALKDKLYATMSTGEQRRFLLGRALVNDPDTLVLDEPTSGLDLKACFRYLDTIRALMRAGKTVVLVTHHIHEIPPEITHAIFLKGGRVVAAGEKTQILTNRALTDLFDTPIELVQANGFYQAMPG
ncbi:MAG TPA: ATP-binding cassette domain-containing protein [Burkholderiales bacterium]